jgi:endonuclease YncB( thermonuclease family)
MEFIRIIFLARAIFSNYDGDTATVNGDHYRIVGMDAPEIHGKCPEERALALKAKAALNQYMNMLDAELAQVKCAEISFVTNTAGSAPRYSSTTKASHRL